jgi:hypothetical protein
MIAWSCDVPADPRSAWPWLATANRCVSDVVWMTSDRVVYSWQNAPAPRTATVPRP